eukprot:6177513-Pleurochrysis_carterae.AAC.4
MRPIEGSPSFFVSRPSRAHLACEDPELWVGNIERAKFAHGPISRLVVSPFNSIQLPKGTQATPARLYTQRHRCALPAQDLRARAHMRIFPEAALAQMCRPNQEFPLGLE